MNTGNYIFTEVIAYLPRRSFNECVDRYNGERYRKRLSCRDQFLALAFGQLSYRESLRDIVVCLSSHHSKLYHLGFRALGTVSSIARANEKRELGIKIYFCHPYHSWEKGSIENVNGEIRTEVPKGSDISKYDRPFFRRLEEKLNNRFMECLNYQTPNEVVLRHRTN